MTIFSLILCNRLFTVFAFALIRLRWRLTQKNKPRRKDGLAWKRFLELPGRDNSLFSPTFLDPSLMLVELEVNGSGAATLDSFYGYVEKWVQVEQNKRLAVSHFLQTMTRKE